MTTPSPLSLSVILCTRNRPADLARCLASLAAQTRLPDEIIIVDASDPAPNTADAPISNLQSPISNPQSPISNLQSLITNNQSPITTLHSPPGLPAQRNLGLRQSRGDVAAFFDDDVELSPTYLEALMAVYERRWNERMGGVMGCDPEWRQSSGGMFWLKRCFGLTHVRRTGARARVLPSLGVTWVAEPQHEIPVEAMPGFCMSYRRAALIALAPAGPWFDESLTGYADGEDVDVSYRVGRRFAMWQTPAARLVHHRSPVARAGFRRSFASRAASERYLHRKLLPRTLATRAAWTWSVVGRLLAAAVVSARHRDLAPLIGTMEGLWKKIGR